MMQPFSSVERNKLVRTGSAPADHHQETTILSVNELQAYATASEFEAVSTKMSSYTCRRAPIPNSSTDISERCLTVFYAGTLNVYDNVPQEKAEAIMKLAAAGHAASDHENPFSFPFPVVPVKDCNYSLSAGDDAIHLEFPNFLQPCEASVPTALRLARKLSLARFLKRRKSRLMASYSPKFERCFIGSGNGGRLFKAHANGVLFGLGGTEREKIAIGTVIDDHAHGFETARISGAENRHSNIDKASNNISESASTS